MTITKNDTLWTIHHESNDRLEFPTKLPRTRRKILLLEKVAKVSPKFFKELSVYYIFTLIFHCICLSSPPSGFHLWGGGGGGHSRQLAGCLPP